MKKIPPVVVALCLIGYFAGVALLFISQSIPGIVKAVVVVVSVIISAVTIAVMVERIREINKGEENDLSKY